jgi:hypothetical protein
MRLSVLLAAAVIVVLPERATAHDLIAKVKLLPDRVVVEAGFDDETPAEGARVAILNESGSEVASGRTDERGECRLSNLSRGKYKAIVEWGGGHRDEVTFEVFAPGFLDAPIEYIRARPNKTIGVVAGVGALLAISFAFWWFRLRKPAN